MSESTRIDSSSLTPPQGPGQDAPAHTIAEATPATKAAPAKKPRRPRPTFDDGALTRTFKFPSKSYPRSSYYVTSTDIIIRIKKARKKWKLIVPKTRVVSYRTNRWFAKPRWVAIELTYTQAVKLGLAEARARTPDAGAEIVDNSPAPPVRDETTNDVATAMAPSPDADAADAIHVVDNQNDLADRIDALGEQDGADDFQITADTDDAELEEHLPLQPPASVEHEQAIQPQAATVPEPSDTRVVPLPLRRLQPTVAPRRTSRHAIAMLAAAVSGLALWAAIDAQPLNPSQDCTSAETTAHCAAPIVTGSIGPVSAPPLVASTPDADLPATGVVEEPPLTPAQTVTVARAELAAQNVATSAPLAVTEGKPDTDAMTSLPRDADSIILAGRDIALPVSAPVFASAQPAPEPTVACDALGESARRLLVHFEYGRALLDPSLLEALDGFAVRLQACPDSKVTIEGHTDSDGRADRNRALSLRRAQAVQSHLVAAGVPPERIAATGFGQTRPTLPNVSPKNKRSNRRAELVVTTQRAP